MDKKNIFIALGIFWLIIIGGLIGYKEYTLKSGEVVVLKTIPVDPRDVFRGDFVALQYEISSPDSQRIVFERNDFKSGEKVYVGLDTSGKYAVATSVSSRRPRAGLFIKGTLKDVRGDGASIEYGIESYFVPEGKGKEIEQYVGQTVDVKVAIDRFGTAVIKALLVDGQEVR